jgi:hypothetical protein
VPGLFRFMHEALVMDATPGPGHRNESAMQTRCVAPWESCVASYKIQDNPQAVFGSNITRE